MGFDITIYIPLESACLIYPISTLAPPIGFKEWLRNNPNSRIPLLLAYTCRCPKPLCGAVGSLAKIKGHHRGWRAKSAPVGFDVTIYIPLESTCSVYPISTLYLQKLPKVSQTWTSKSQSPPFFCCVRVRGLTNMPPRWEFWRKSKWITDFGGSSQPR